MTKLNHLKALGIKFVVISIVLLSILGIFQATASIGEILMISFLVTGVAYVIGDLFVLPRFGNLIATIGDFGLSFLSVWILGSLFIEPTYSMISASLFSAIFISLSEALFHPYVKNKVLEKETENQILVPQRVRYQSEFAEENDVYDIKQDKLSEEEEE